jgi:hypothetical protein
MHFDVLQKMSRIRKVAPAFVIVALLFVFGYLSKPDRGGLSRCSRIFAISKLEEYSLTHKPFATWDIFESPKFRFALSTESYERLAVELKRQGYSEWKRGGVTFGSVDVGWAGDEDNIYCRLTRSGYHYYWSYSAKTKVIYAITFPS